MKVLKNTMAVILLAAVLMLASACGEDVAPFLGLSSVPSINPSVSTETVKHFYSHYNDTLTPSEEYGELVPFAGNMLTYKSTAEGDGTAVTQPVYGLCTVDGKIVVDPVYDAVINHELNGGHLYELLIGSADVNFAEKRMLIASDGSWMMELSSDCAVSDISGSDRFAIERKGTIRRNKKKVTVVYYDFYTFDGVPAFTFDKALTEAENTVFTIGNFADGFAPVNVTVTTETVEKDEEGNDVTIKTEEKSAYFIDTSGKNAFQKKKFIKTEEFSAGCAVVQTEDGAWGVLKSDGDYLLDPQFRVINRNASAGYFACGSEGYFLIIDTSGQTVSQVFCENADITVLGTESIIYKKTLDFTGKTEFFSCVTGGAFTCKETGRFPDKDSGKFGIFTCSYSGVTDVFDHYGNSLAHYTDFGELYGVYGNIAVISHQSGNKVSVLNISTGEKTDWIDGTFSGQVHDDGNYIVLKKDGKYLLYGVAEKKAVIEDCDYMNVMTSGTDCYLNAYADGYVTLYGKGMNVLMRYCCSLEVPR